MFGFLRFSFEALNFKFLRFDYLKAAAEAFSLAIIVYRRPHYLFRHQGEAY